jgi:methyl-accepting chemotaxis protein
MKSFRDKFKNIFFNGNFTAASKIQFGFFIIIILISIIGYLTYINMGDLKGHIVEIESTSIPAARTNAPIEKEVIKTRLGIYKWTLGEGKLEEVQGSINQIKKLAIKQKTLIDNEAIKKSLDEILEKTKAYETALSEYTLSSDPKYFKQMKELGVEITDLTKESRVRTWQSVSGDITEIVNYLENIEQKVTIFALICILFGIGIGIIINRNLNKVATKIKGATNSVLDGAEKTRIRAKEMTSSAREVENSIEDASGSVELMDSNTDDVAFAINQVSSSIVDISSTVEELSHRSQDILNSVEDVHNQIAKTSQRIEKGQGIVNEGVQAMFELDDKIEDIGEMSSTIMDITEQTNLLALNAAIEAARAGEKGKGFAVVAEEIQELAQKSAEAAEHIEKVISQVRDAANSTIEVMVENNNAKGAQSENIERIFNSIEEEIKEINDTVDNVVQVTEDQAAGNEEVSASAQEISASAQEVSSQIEEVSNASKDLKDNIDDIMEANKSLLSHIEDQADSTKEQLKLTKDVVEANKDLK